jgi:penicillin amidase
MKYILVLCIVFISCSRERKVRIEIKDDVNDANLYVIDPARMAKTVVISRDNYGIPHITGPTDESVLFGLAYARSEDHFELIEDIVIGAIGRMSEVKGESAIAGDYAVRIFRTNELSKDEYNNFTNKIKLLCDSYAAGLNYYLETHPDVKPKLITRFEPWHMVSVERSMWGSFGLSLAGYKEDEVSKYIRDNRLEPQTGSNMWAISPTKTKNGKAYLVINPHVPSDQPYEVHLKSDEGMNFYGMMAYGTNILPVVGHNDSLGWSLTVNYPDVGDAFKIAFDHATDPLKYRFDGDYLSAETWQDSIIVKTDSGKIARQYTFLKTIHGPVFSRDGKNAVAYQSSGIERGGTIPQFYKMNRSKGLKDFKAAISRTALAFHNIMYADKDGNILYVYNGAIPVRNNSFDWRKPVDGSDPDSKWQGYHSLEELPQVFNPKSGYVQNCNSNPFRTTSGKNPDKNDFPDYMTNLQPDTERAERSKVILDSLKVFSLSTLEGAIMDTYVHRAGETMPGLFDEYNDLLDEDESRAQRLRGPIEALQKWDKFADVDSKEATLYLYSTSYYSQPRSQKNFRKSSVSKEQLTS